MENVRQWVLLGFLVLALFTIVATTLAFIRKAKKFAWPLIIVNGLLTITAWVYALVFKEYVVIGTSLTMIGMLALSIALLVRKDLKKSK